MAFINFLNSEWLIRCLCGRFSYEDVYRIKYVNLSNVMYMRYGLLILY